MKKKNFKNIGNVAISEIALCDTNIGLYIPIEKMSENIRIEYEDSENYFISKVKEQYPEIDLTKYLFLRDISLHININNGEVNYTVSIILWLEDEQGEEFFTEFFDPFEVEINDEDNKYLRRLVINKLMDTFFN